MHDSSTKTALALFIFAAATFVSAQAQERDFRREFKLDLLAMRDTIAMLAGETVTLTDPKWNWRDVPTCVLRVFKNGLETRSSNAVSIVKKGNQPGVQYIVHSRLRFDTAGTYHVLRIVEGHSPDNRLFRYGDVWTMHVRWPRLHPLVDNEYWYGETASFTFAAGHENYGSYSFDVESGGQILLTQQGATVDIERIWRELPTEELNRTITVRAKYRGTSFLYEDPLTHQVRESLWRFELKSPNKIEDVSLWMIDSTYDRLKAEDRWDTLAPLPLNINKTGRYNPREFRFSSYAVNRMSFLMFLPDVRDVAVLSNPPEFLSSVAWRSDDPWRVLVIKPQEQLLRDRSARNPLEVALTVRFRDQFGTLFSRTYKARVYLHQ
ncbi:MAG: hypothetical protein C4326_12060 [Ignavibacteria bacterium]